MDFIKGSKKLAFYGVKDSQGGYVYHRMKGFDEISTSLNPNEYTRKYVDEEYERSDVTRYSPSISFSLDQSSDDPVHKDIAEMAKKEKIGIDAIRPIIIVDTTKTEDNATKRDYSVIIEGEDPGEEFYKYTGSFKVNGEKVFGIAITEDDWQTIEFAEDDSE